MSGFEVHYLDQSEYSFPVDKINAVLQTAQADDTVQAMVAAQNVNPVGRLRYNDHGPEHVETVLEMAIELYELLTAADISFNGASDHGLSQADEPVIIALGVLLHDVGHVVHRDRHEEYSVMIAQGLVERILADTYEPKNAAKLLGEVLHGIATHHREGRPLTREAGVIRVADALDMEHGRSRIPYEEGGRGINTISSQAIQAVRLCVGEEVPVRIEIDMSSAAGIYQIDELLKSKIEHSQLEEFIRVVAIRVGTDDQLIDRVEL